MLWQRTWVPLTLKIQAKIQALSQGRVLLIIITQANQTDDWGVSDCEHTSYTAVNKGRKVQDGVVGGEVGWHTNDDELMVKTNLPRHFSNCVTGNATYWSFFFFFKEIYCYKLLIYFFSWKGCTRQCYEHPQKEDSNLVGSLFSSEIILIYSHVFWEHLIMWYFALSEQTMTR